MLRARPSKGPFHPDHHSFPGHPHTQASLDTTSQTFGKQHQAFKETLILLIAQTMDTYLFSASTTPATTWLAWSRHEATIQVQPHVDLPKLSGRQRILPHLKEKLDTPDTGEAGHSEYQETSYPPGEL